MTDCAPTRYRVEHVTRYEYAFPVSLALQLLHLKPRNCAHQVLEASQIHCDPAATRMREELDCFGNPVIHLALDRPHDHLELASDMTVAVTPPPPLDLDRSPAWDQVLHDLTYHCQSLSPDAFEAQRFRFESPHVRVKGHFSRFAEACFPEGQPLLSGAQALMEKIFDEFTFDATATQIATPLLTVLEEKRGVCQDFSHLMLACLRSLGLPARYVSGYLLTTPPPGQPRLIGADATHAWVSVYCPHHGWVDFDPTNNKRPSNEHITVAWGRDFSDVSPLRGVLLGGGAHDPQVEVTVTPLDELPATDTFSPADCAATPQA